MQSSCLVTQMLEVHTGVMQFLCISSNLGEDSIVMHRSFPAFTVRAVRRQRSGQIPILCKLLPGEQVQLRLLGDGVGGETAVGHWLQIGF